MKYSPSMIDYQKDGTWTVYDENGNVIDKEQWVKGEEIKK